VTERTPDSWRIVLAVALFLCAWALLHVGFYERDQIIDTPIYEQYGKLMRDGQVPYRDFRVEYPPLALPVFFLPALPGDDYRQWFETLMALCGCGLVVAVGLAARRLALGFGTLAYIALAPLALGSVLLTRFDLWPAMLTAFALAALLAQRVRSGHLLLGVAVAAKLYPAVLLPLAIVQAWRRGGRREALLCGGLCASVVLAAYLPFLLIAPDGVAASVGRQLSRPLQIESLGAAVLLAAHQLFGAGIEMHSSHGSQNLVGPAADVLAVLLSVAQVATLVWLWVRFARGEQTPARLARYAAASLVAFVALGKVLSPQFLAWLLPVVPLARRMWATFALTLALVLTQLWFPYRYWDLVREFDPLTSWLVLGRDLALVVTLALLVREPARGQART
jgi:glycosyl transferase family 87